VYHWYDGSKIGEVSPDHEKRHTDHFSQQPGSGSLQVCPSGQAVNLIFLYLSSERLQGCHLEKTKE